MTDEKKKMTSEDFGLNLTESPKEKQEQLEKSLGVLVQASRETIQRAKEKNKMESKCVRCGKSSDLGFWDFYQTDEGYICKECEPEWAKDFFKKQEEKD